MINKTTLFASTTRPHDESTHHVSHAVKPFCGTCFSVEPRYSSAKPFAKERRNNEELNGLEHHVVKLEADEWRCKFLLASADEVEA